MGSTINGASNELKWRSSFYEALWIQLGQQFSTNGISLWNGTFLHRRLPFKRRWWWWWWWSSGDDHIPHLSIYVHLYRLVQFKEDSLQRKLPPLHKACKACVNTILEKRIRIFTPGNFERAILFFEKVSRDKDNGRLLSQSEPSRDSEKENSPLLGSAVFRESFTHRPIQNAILYPAHFPVFFRTLKTFSRTFYTWIDP